MMRLSRLLTVFLCLCGSAAAANDIVTTGHARSQLTPEHGEFAPGQTTWFAFRQQLEPGWHVYWENPGDSGLPLDLQWRLPEGFEAGAIVYPTPERIPVGPLANYGHHGEPTFLIPITAPLAAPIGESVEVSLKATWLICADICVPEEGEFAVRLEIADALNRDALGESVVQAARLAAPSPHEGGAQITPLRKELLLSFPKGDAFKEAYFFPRAEGLIEPAEAQHVKSIRNQIIISMTPGAAYAPDETEAVDGVLVLTDRNGIRRGFDLIAKRSEAAPATAIVQGGRSLTALLAMAFFGGVILNIMPCVFPILFIKAASLMKDAQGRAAVTRRNGLIYGAGVIVTFAVLGAILLVLRAGGEQLGWGFHLQSPAVVIVSAYVLLLVGLNLAGVFSVGASIQGVGGGLAGQENAVGAFFAGALAVFIAAPCIGPLLSAPMGAALLLPPLAGMAIFIAMAMGLAIPYVALSFAPGLGKQLPRPGPWMSTFKQALAFPVFAAAAYFLWVLSQQTGPTGLAKALAGVLLLAFGAWLFEKSKNAGAYTVAVRAAVILAVLAALTPIGTLRLVDAAQASEGKYGALESISYDARTLDALRASGRAVFVDFTAAWCVTCQFNKLAVLSKPSLASAFAEEEVSLMVADWTTRDPAVTAALAEFGASGVPLYVYYPPVGEPVVLSLPLSESAILKQVRKEGEHR